MLILFTLIHQIYPSELQLRIANSDTEAPFSDLNLSKSNYTVVIMIVDKRDNFDLILLITRFLMAMSLRKPFMECIYLNLFVSLEHLTLMSSTVVIKPWSLSFRKYKNIKKKIFFTSHLENEFQEMKISINSRTDSYVSLLFLFTVIIFISTGTNFDLVISYCCAQMCGKFDLFYKK